MSSQKTVTSIAAGSAVALSAVFAILKLAGVIAWSWWAVTSPMWIFAVVVVLAVLWAFWIIANY